MTQTKHNKNNEVNIYGLGPAGTFSDSAAENVAKQIGESVQIEDVVLVNLEQTVRKVLERTGNEGIGVIPYSNKAAGVVLPHLMLLDEYAREFGVRASQCVNIPVGMYAGVSDSKNADTIYSHPKALEQSSKWINENYPEAKQVATNSTAEAAGIVAKLGGVALASSKAISDAGLTLLNGGKDVGNVPDNYTSFFVVAREGSYGGKLLEDLHPSEKRNGALVSLAPSIDRPGLLMKLWTPLSENNVNATGLWTMPNPHVAEQEKPDYNAKMFLLELGRSENERVSVIEQWKMLGANPAVLGTYMVP